MKAASVSRRYDILSIPHVNKKARRRLAEVSALFFIDRYCTNCRKGFLKTRVPRSMYRIIKAMQLGVTSGTPYHIRMPRGHGKSSYVKGVTMWALATGHSHFVEAVAANGRKASAILRDIWACMNYSPRFAEDFPEIAVFIRKCAGNERRAPFVTFKGENCGMKKSADEICLPTVMVNDVPTVSSGSVLLAVGFSANVRGEVMGSQRPDLIIFDDLQDREMANSQERVADAIGMIKGDFMGGDSHTDISSAFMTSTPICPDDLSEQFAADPYWRTETFKMLEKFPDCFNPADENGLWQQFAKLWQEENVAYQRDPHPACNKFYEEHRAEMDKGAKVLNAKNFKKNEVSAIEHAMILYFTRGKKTFDAEYQMEPQRLDALFEITPKLVLSRVRPGTNRGDDITNCVFTAAATDINPSYALSTAICRFDLARSCFVTAYFVQRCAVDSKVNDTAYNRKIYELLVQHVNAVKGLGIKLNAYGIDAGGKQWDPVTRLSQMSNDLFGFTVTPMAGRAGRSWNPNVRTRIRDSLNDTVFCRDQQNRMWLAFNADTYREQMQRAWGAETGAPGGCSLYDGGITHTEFAVQLSNERLIAKQKLLDGRIDFHWKTKEPHDFGDCLSMCYALAGSRGISGGTSIVAPAQEAKLVAVNESHAVETDDGIVIGCDF